MSPAPEKPAQRRPQARRPVRPVGPISSIVPTFRDFLGLISPVLGAVGGYWLGILFSGLFAGVVLGMIGAGIGAYYGRRFAPDFFP